MKLTVSSSPHIRDNTTTSVIMARVVAALTPALLAGVFIFGPRALMVTLVSVVSAVFFEYAWHKLRKSPDTIDDLSAVVTGMLLGLSMPVAVPYYIPVIGAFFAIIIVKQCFGGLGCNIVNPALAARAFLLASWPVQMTFFTRDFQALPLFGKVDAVSSATPLANTLDFPDYASLLLGIKAGCIGEVCILALLAGFIYLLTKKIISPIIPVSFMGTVFLITWLLGPEGFGTGNGLAHVLSGSVVLASVFMATDYVTSPMTQKGQLIMGIGCGLLTSIIRLYGGYPEGATYAILIMNILTPIIDKYTMPKKFGSVKAGVKNA